MRLAALVASSVLCVGCDVPGAGAQPHVPPPAAQPLPDPIRSLRMFVPDAQGVGRHDQVAQALEGQLRAAGVATTKVGEPRDLDAVLNASPTGLQLTFVKPDGSQVTQMTAGIGASDVITWARCLMAPPDSPSKGLHFLIPVEGAGVFGLGLESPDSSRCEELLANAAADLVRQMSRSQPLAMLNATTSPPATAPSSPPAPSTVASTPAAPPAAAPSAASALVSASPQPTAYAIVIGIEKYSASLPPPTGARADAQRFSDLVRASLGVPAGHVQTLFDEQATKGSIERALASAQASVPPGGRIYFYFSGHGAPDASAGTSYIVPADGDPQFLDATAIPMKEVLTKLGQSKAREVLAIVDSCFSGAGGRSVLPPGARPIVRVREEAAPSQLALFSASSGSEISGPTADGNGGLFTKYVVDGLGTGAADMNGDGQVSLSELSQWVQPRVSREAKKANRDQNPALTVGKGLGSADSFIVEWGLPAK
jgi:hypothetical protein